jgi:hypothetical protein
MFPTFSRTRRIHGPKKIDEEFSRHFMAREITRVDGGLMIAFPPEQWRIFRDMATQEFAESLRRVAQQVNLERYPKSHRGEKKPKPKRRHSKKRPHVSSARLLEARKAKKQRAKK